MPTIMDAHSGPRGRSGGIRPPERTIPNQALGICQGHSKSLHTPAELR